MTPMTEPQISSTFLLRSSVAEIWQKKAVLLRALILPVLAALTIQTASTLYVRTNIADLDWVVFYTLMVLGIPFYVMFATACHRIILLGDNSPNNRWGITWSIRETRFTGWLFVLTLITTAITIPIFFAVRLASSWAFDGYLASLPYYACVLVSTFIDARLSLILPATAIGRTMSLGKSWKLTADHISSIFNALLAPILATQLFDYLVFDLWFSSSSLAVGFIRSLFIYPLIAVAVVIITLAYRNLEMVKEDEIRSKPRRRFYFE
jgi:hypothetical protein